MSTTLRSKLIRFAASHPEHRALLLPLLTAGANSIDMPPALDKIVKPMLQDAIDEVESSYEGWNTNVFKPGGQGFHFGSGTDGGYGAETHTALGNLISSGSFPRNPKLDVLHKAEDVAYEAAKKAWVEDNKDFITSNNLTDDQITYNDLYELGFGEEAENWSEMQTEFYQEEDITFRIGVFYFNADNSQGIRGTASIEVFALADFDGHYLPNKSIELYSEKFPLPKKMTEFKSVLARVLAEAVKACE